MFPVKSVYICAKPLGEVDYPAIRVCWMAMCCSCQFSKALHLPPQRQDMFHTSTLSTGEPRLSVLPQVKCTSAQMICGGKKKKQKNTGEMRKTAAGVRGIHEKQSHHRFFFFPSTKYGLQCDRMTDKLFGNLFGSSSWLAVLLVVGSQRRQW